jgi:alkanesulfonate monooxygenase SsuD/methylene tetrahydromethanopterin reductase-like flavin-dependent oxidoreductase (luciferase family)
MTDSTFRLGFFSYLSGPGSAAQVYSNVTELFVAAESLGLDSVWVAQHHFGSHGGLPSPLLFLASVAERTRRISLGTAVLTLPFDGALRVAEDAAVFETLFPGRLQLGVGTGFGSPALHELFEVDPAQKRAVYTERLERILAALRGEALDATQATLFPPVPALLDRIWEGPSQLEGVEAAANRGSGLLLSRVAIGAGATPTSEVQIPFVDRLSEISRGQGKEPRVVLSRTILPAASKAAAEEALRPGFERLIPFFVAQTPELADYTLAQHLALANVHYGDADDIVDSLSKEPTIDRITDLVFQVQPAEPTQQETLEIIETVATQVAPRLGWRLRD